jgi:rhodanese-related sulfurtransferase
MGWTILLISVAVIVAILLLRNLGQISPRVARTHLQQGALVVDVRTNAEFQARHLPNALHIPLEEIESLAGRRIKDKDQVLLLHCETGRRSVTASRKFGQLGYTRVFNLGSYTRAARIVGNG